ncbi:MAG: pilus assembly protein PilX [Gammaproteobacteria bacterium]|nr:pilus assembly protein PilX [Gammaproteobacteria bacterium]
MKTTRYQFGHGERGAVLITALMILLLLTIFGVSTMDTNILDEKMAGNMRDRNTAFQAAESALRAGENWLASQTVLPDIRDIGNAADTSPIWDLNSPDQEFPNMTNNVPWWEERDTAWWTGKAVVIAANQADAAWVPGVFAQPGYLIELLPPSLGSLEAGQALDGADVFLQITARGVGGSDSSVVVLQSTFKW